MSQEKDPGALAGTLGADQGAAGQQLDHTPKPVATVPSPNGAAGDDGTGAPSPDGVTSERPVDDRTVIVRLAALPLLDYDREREAAAEQLRCRVTTLDRLVEEMRGARSRPDAGDPGAALEAVNTGHGRALTFPKIEPWPAPVVGAVLLDELAATIREYVVISEVQADAIALWIVHTHAFEGAHMTPKLVAKSAVMRSGKSRLSEVLERTVARPFLVAGGITSAALLRIIEMHAPTVLIDEMDALMNSNRELSEALRGLLNSGFSRSGAHRTISVPLPGGGWEPRVLSTWAPKFLSGIGDLPGTIRDRSIEIVMRRKLSGETVKRLRRKDCQDLAVLARKVARWTQDNLKLLRDAQPQMPAGLNDRAADGWEPLFAIADQAGEQWPQRARVAALAIANNSGDETDTAIMLLGDLRELFAAESSGVLFTNDILTALEKREDRPWAEYRRGRTITANQLAELLKAYGITTNLTVRRGARTAKGYRAEWFADAWTRYLPPRQAVTRSHVSYSAAPGDPDAVTGDAQPVTPLATAAVTPGEAVTGSVTDES
jgi:putative DNA primase/helicase